MKHPASALALCAALATAVAAQAPTLPTYLKEVSATVSGPVAPSQKGMLTVNVKIAPGWHIYANKPGDEYAVPTVVEVRSGKGVAFGAPAYSAPTAGDGGTKIHADTLTVSVPFVVASGTPAGRMVVNGVLKSQGCNDSSCLPPSKVDFKATLVVGKK